MKKGYYNLVLMLICMSFIACKKNTYVAPNDTGKHVFSILQSLDTMDAETFRSYFISMSTMQEMMERVSVPDALQEEAETLNSAQFTADMDAMFYTLKQEANDHYVNLNEIEYVEYEYDSILINGVTSFSGKLFVRKGKELFHIPIFSLEYQHEFYLVTLGKLSKDE